ncbi:unnamed protein product [Cuscuta campestris]|uniref:Reverse transcriptase domain-containing protein n=1 Tax=Cuscuta campestris TaxID=132261 RepID=A0A484NI97_9ASTE|nr:unnamed protein product [Cuscuta campestris]
MEATKFPSQYVKWVQFCISSTTYTLMINGESFGYFKGGKGIRQGDPLSPLLFTQVMEYLTRTLTYYAGISKFKYHPMCKGLNIISLAFAGDLIVACKADMDSIKMILSCLEHFKNVTGMEVNYNKPRMVLGGVSEEEAREFLRLARMSRGDLPFKYLGGPITASRITERDCEALVQKLTSRITVWATKHLSYAGRYKLINSVLLGIISFWCRLFIIPNKVMQKIQSLCRNFLWSSKAEYNRVPAVSWEDVCWPKKEGGLGIKNLVLWNYACGQSLLWDIANKKDILWVKWIHNRYLKGTTIWDIKVKPGMCYYLRKILQNRRMFEDMIIGGNYEIQKGYELLMGVSTEFQAYQIVWNKLTAPKHQFLSWLGWRNRISTKVRSNKFMDIDTNCVLCPNGEEDKNHLFYTCPYTRDIKEEIGQWLQFRWKANNDEEMKEEIKRIKGRKHRQIILAGFAAICYAVWKARNHKIKQQRSISTGESKEWIKFQLETYINNKLRNMVLC